MRVHRRHRAPVRDHRCKACGRAPNVFTGTVLHGTPKRPSQIMLILRGLAQGVPTTPRRPGVARDADGDGVREVHCNTAEDLWTDLRNFPRPVRGVSKGFLEQYVVMFEWSHNLKGCTLSFLRASLTPRPYTE